MTAILLMLCLVIPGFIRTEQAIHRASEAAANADAVATDTTNAVALNGQIVDCLTAWVHDETETLVQRDVVNDVSRRAHLAVWLEVGQWMQAPTPAEKVRALAAVADLRAALYGLLREKAMVVYPTIEQCLNRAPLPDPVGR